MTSENKVLVVGVENMTSDRLQEALNELYSRGVPGWASLSVSQSMGGTQWTIVAKWDPWTRSTAIKPPEIHVEINEDRAETPEEREERRQIQAAQDASMAKSRRVRDNPQA